MIKKFDTEAAYEAAEKSTAESTISLVDENNSTKIDGVNVVTKSPKIGDILCVNADGDKLWIAFGTYNSGSLPSGYTAKGVVAKRHGNILLIASTTNKVQKWLEVYPYVVTDYVLDGAEHTVQLRLTGLPSTTTWFDFTYTATTDDEFVTALQAFLTDNSLTNWSAYKDDAGRVILQRNDYTNWEYYTSTRTYCKGGLTLTEKVKLDVTEILGGFRDGFYSKCGKRMNGLWNFKRGKDYLSDDIDWSTAFNPTSPVTADMTGYPVCLPAYLGKSDARKDDDGNYVDYCAHLREAWGEGEEGWINYLKAATIVPRSPMGGSGQCRNELEITNAFSEITYKDTDGNDQPLYTAFKFCHDTDLGTDGLTAGNFFLPNLTTIIDYLGEATLGISGVTSSTCDPLNRSLAAIGADRRQVNWTMWTCSPNRVSFARNANGHGYFEGSYYCYRNCVGPLALYTLPAEQE